jgi:site-specific DNA-methyltransferase (adenine-specific)
MVEPCKLIIGDSRVVMGTEIPANSIDLIVTSPPYNCKIKYDSWDDEVQYADYLVFMREWLTSAYNVLKDDGRIAINIFYEISQPGRGGRVFVASDIHQIMKEIGYKFNGVVRLNENQSERVDYCAWGSWKSASAPYIYNPEECVIIACKKVWKKQNKGISTIGRDEFMESVKGVWDYRAATSTKTKASFSIELPLRAINILSYEGDLVLDPFNGRGTTGAACKILDRNYIGVDISPNYIEIARSEINNMVSKHHIDKVFEYARAHGVIITAEKNVRKYITEHPTFVKDVCDTIADLDMEIELHIYEYCKKDRHLQITVREFGIYEGFMSKLDLLPNGFHDETGGMLLVTTDFDVPKFKKPKKDL